MAIPALKLDLAPPSTFWRQQHLMLGWSALAAGGLLLAASLAFTWRAYAGASAAGRQTVTLMARTQAFAQTEREVLAELRSVDVAKELPRWRLAEKIFTERSLPWSRLTAELERTLATDVRLKSVQRNRSTDMRVQLKLKGEARSRKAEAAFVEALQKDPLFEQVLLEREGDRQGGGVDFECTLAVSPTPPPFVPLPSRPRYAASPASAKAAAPKPLPNRAAATPPRPGPSGLRTGTSLAAAPLQPGAQPMPMTSQDRARQRRLEMRGGFSPVPDNRPAPRGNAQ